MNKHLFILFTLSTSFLSAQNQNIEKKIIPVLKYKVSKTVDPSYGITMFEPLNYRLGGDSVRIENGHASNGWKKDYYESGVLLHKGFYVDGRLKIYSNFYSNGDVERVFKAVDDYKSTMKIYYKGDILKSQIKYVGSSSRKWEDYYPNGFLEYYEEYHRSGDYYITEKWYYNTGQVKSLFVLIDKKNLSYLTKEFYEDGTVKTEGISFYSKSMMSYLKTDTWKHFNKTGKLTKEQVYLLGKLDKEVFY